MNWIYRIKEQTVNGKTLFYPQRRKLLGFADIIVYHEYRMRDEVICFDTIEEAKSWINKEIIDSADDLVVTKFHEV
jgi:hypothetical protein